MARTRGGITRRSRSRSNPRTRSATQSAGRTTEGPVYRRTRSSAAQSEVEEEDTQPMQPIETFFPHTMYSEACKFATKCDVAKTVEIIEEVLDDDEKMWFHQHYQFKHIFHMFKHLNRKLMGMWMLFLRAVITKKKQEIWFVVNGVPIRYSMREHALLTGLDCTEYLDNRENVGNFGLIDRCFKNNNRKIDMNDVEKKLKSMGKTDDRLKVAVLYFLCTVIERKSKDENGYIEPFLLRVVDHLDYCKTFPWGRYTFRKSMASIKKVLTRLRGKLEKHSSQKQVTDTFPGFILPWEIMAFECIPELKKAFREDVEHTPGIIDSLCPRMCKHRFKITGHKGISLEEIYDALGTTKEIHSILEPEADEITLMRRLTVDVVDDKCDAIPDCWMRQISSGRDIYWEDLFQKDISSRKSKAKGVRDLGVDAEDEEVVQPVADSRIARTELERFDALEKKLMKKCKKMNKKLKRLEAKNKDLEQKISELRNGGNGGNHDTRYDDYYCNAYAEIPQPEEDNLAREEVEPEEGMEVNDDLEEENLGSDIMEEDTEVSVVPEEENLEKEAEPEEENLEKEAGPEEENLEKEAEPIEESQLLKYSEEWEKENEYDHTPLLKRLYPQRNRKPSKSCLSPYAK